MEGNGPLLRKKNIKERPFPETGTDVMKTKAQHQTRAALHEFSGGVDESKTNLQSTCKG